MEIILSSSVSLSPVSADELGEGDTAGLVVGTGALSAGDADGCTVEAGAIPADGRSDTSVGLLPERGLSDGLLFSLSIGADVFILSALSLGEADLEFCSLRVELQAVSANISKMQSSKYMILRMFYLLVPWKI
ncbi:hypothetical protein L1765_14295 [Microaerobacter geothermalis]|jgi:hypothetical protein|uniref:hypothetical protein n=1 Tax=Microaerobacter geothermalis TaxID=674972 RepID=UPI001F2106C1|nr:hypothetical protein [Microaerobacter geothermalis]MCF6095131.1 hypothetical protein [Microaerobacter geothermalis]